MTDIRVSYEAEVKEQEFRPAELPTDEEGKEMGGERPGLEEHVRMRIQPSPAPFSRYQASAGDENHEGQSRLPAGLTTADIKPSAVPRQGRIVHHGEDQVGVSCCKCVIM